MSLLRRLPRSLCRRPFSSMPVNQLTSYPPAQTFSESKRVLMIDPDETTCVSEFVQRGHHVDIIENVEDDHLKSLVQQYDAVLSGSHTKLNGTTLSHAPQLQMIGLPDAESGNVDLAMATRQGILVMHHEETKGIQAIAEAELTLSLLFNLARKVPAASRSVKAQAATQPEELRYERDAFMGQEIAGKTLGIVGLGRVGKIVATLAKAMGMNILAYDKMMAKEEALEYGATKCSLRELYTKSDYLTFHAPLTEQTRSLFNEKSLEICKKDVKLVVASAADIVDMSMLEKALTEQQLGGVAMDVYSSDPLAPAFKPILQHPNTLCTPNLGDSFEEAKTRSYHAIAKQMCDALAQREYNGVTNAPFMPLTLRPEMQPFLQLAEAMGKLQGQLTSEQIVRVSVATAGGQDIDIAQPRARNLLLAAVMKGLVDQLGGEVGCGYVNATLMGMERGIISLAGESQGNEDLGLNNSITLEILTSSGKKALLVGSVFGVEPRIVQVDQHQSFPAFKPEGALLFFNNEDRPGAWASLLKVLADEQINVAKMALARQQDTGKALGILTLDDTLASSTLSKLTALDSFENVRGANMGNKSL